MPRYRVTVEEIVEVVYEVEAEDEDDARDQVLQDNGTQLSYEYIDTNMLPHDYVVKEVK